MLSVCVSVCMLAGTAVVQDGRTSCDRRASAGETTVLGGVTVTGGIPAYMYRGAEADVGLCSPCSKAGVGPTAASA